jgi:hypothetical protein
MYGIAPALTKIHGAMARILSDLKLARFSNSLVATLAILPSMSLIPSAPFCRLHFVQPPSPTTANQGTN